MGPPVVTVRGQAQVETAPDVATLSVTVHSTGSTADTVRDALARASTRIRALLEEHAASLARFSTSGLHVAPVFGHRSGTKITGYRGSVSASLLVTDFDALSDLVLSLTALPDSQVDGPWWSLQPDHPAHRDVRLAAITDARRRAEDYAAAVGLGLGDLIEVSDVDAGGFGGPPARMARSFPVGAESAPSFDFEPALQTVTGQVTVRFTMIPSDVP